VKLVVVFTTYAVFRLKVCGSLKITTFKIATVLFIDYGGNEDSNTHYAHSSKVSRSLHVLNLSVVGLFLHR
jgi:hypothetical protein